ncbi:DUF2914 domain-containing protein [Candidatus Nomurabacteria bacterium]|nr:DUF2914 domain-containing protein [Candidatus Nomurabacteria bacterium]
MFDKTRGLFSFIRHHWLTFGFILGFITDTILLNQIDNLVDNLVLLFYVLLATTTMLLLYVGVAEKAPGVMVGWFKKYAPILMQYSFGGLLSGMLIFYGRSGDWLASAPFLVLILVVILGNEFLGKRSDRLVYNITLYFIGLFSYVVLVMPVLTGIMGDWMFVLSGFISIVIVSFVIRILYKIVPNFMEANIRRVILAVGFMYVGFNVLYFTSLIPPIPLSLTDMEIVQSVNKLESGGYRVVSELQPWYRSIPFIHPVIHPTGGSIACFARVYAPTKLSTKIYHRWEYKDEAGTWREHFRLGYDISGINQGGYGGYTKAESFFPGVWRCSVETARGQILGREIVNIDTKGKVGPMETQIR